MIIVEPNYDMRSFLTPGRAVFCTRCARTVYSTSVHGKPGNELAESAARSHEREGCEQSDLAYSDHQALAAYRLDQNTTQLTRLGTVSRGMSPIKGWGRSSLARTARCRECNEQVARTNVGAADGGVRIVEIKAGEHLLNEHLNLLNRNDPRAQAFAHLTA